MATALANGAFVNTAQHAVHALVLEQAGALAMVAGTGATAQPARYALAATRRSAGVVPVVSVNTQHGINLLHALNVLLSLSGRHHARAVAGTAPRRLPVARKYTAAGTQGAGHLLLRQVAASRLRGLWQVLEHLHHAVVFLGRQFLLALTYRTSAKLRMRSRALAKGTRFLLSQLHKQSMRVKKNMSCFIYCITF